MAGKTTVFASDFLKLIFNGTTIANIAKNVDPGDSPLTNLFLSLHTGDPEVVGNTGNAQTYLELQYNGGGQRVGVVRSLSGWTVTGNSVSPASVVNFPEKTSGTGGTATFVGIGTSQSNAGKLLWSGELSTPIVVTADGTVPSIKTSSTITET
jgi:hypothetical protein